MASEVFNHFVREFPNSLLAQQNKNFEGKGFVEGAHGEFARLMFIGDLYRAISQADRQNQIMLMMILFPDFVDKIYVSEK